MFNWFGHWGHLFDCITVQPTWHFSGSSFLPFCGNILDAFQVLGVILISLTPCFCSKTFHGSLWPKSKLLSLVLEAFEDLLPAFHSGFNSHQRACPESGSSREAGCTDFLWLAPW